MELLHSCRSSSISVCCSLHANGSQKPFFTHARRQWNICGAAPATTATTTTTAAAAAEQAGNILGNNSNPWGIASVRVCHIKLSYGPLRLQNPWHGSGTNTVQGRKRGTVLPPQPPHPCDARRSKSTCKIWLVLRAP